MRCCALLHMCIMLAFTPSTAQQLRTCVLKALKTSSLCADQRQKDHKSQSDEFSNVSVAVHIQGFNATAYKCVDIWVRLDQVHDVQHALRKVHALHAPEVKASIPQYGLGYRCVFISVTDVQLITKTLEAFNILDQN